MRRRHGRRLPSALPAPATGPVGVWDRSDNPVQRHWRLFREGAPDPDIWNRRADRLDLGEAHQGGPEMIWTLPRDACVWEVNRETEAATSRETGHDLIAVDLGAYVQFQCLERDLERSASTYRGAARDEA